LTGVSRYRSVIPGREIYNHSKISIGPLVTNVQGKHIDERVLLREYGCVSEKHDEKTTKDKRQLRAFDHPPPCLERYYYRRYTIRGANTIWLRVIPLKREGSVNVPQPVWNPVWG